MPGGSISESGGVADFVRAAAAIGTERARSACTITVRNGVAEGGRGTITVRNAGGEFNVPL